MLVTPSGIATSRLIPAIRVDPFFESKSPLTDLYDELPAATINSVKPLQPENAPFPMLITLSGIVMLVSPLQSLNAQSPMLVTLSGIVTLVSPLQP